MIDWLPYLALFSARARLLFQYRAAAFAGLATQLFWGVMRVMVFTAFYQSSSLASSAPISLQEVITYVWLSQALLALLPWNLDREVEQLVRTGNVVYELVKPLNLFWYWYCRAMAMRLIPASLKALPVALIAGFFLDLSPPPSVASGALFAVSLVGALALSAAITTLMMSSLFWTVTSEGITKLMPAVILIFSGMLIPLPLFPEWLQPVIYFLPFRGIIDTPFQLYSGHHSIGALVHQWVWVGILITYGHWVMNRATKRLVVHGG